MSLSTIPFFWHKLASTAGLLLITVIFSYLPFVIRKRVRKAGLIMSYCNALAGGIVLGAMLMHMIPEMMESCSGHSHTDLVKVQKAVKVHTHEPGHAHEHKKPCSHGHGAGCGHKHDHDHKHDHKEHKVDKTAKATTTTTSAEHGHAHGFAWGPFFAGVSFLILFAIDRLFLTHSHCADAHPHAHGEAQHHHKEDVEHHGACANKHDPAHDHCSHHEDYSIQKDTDHGSCHEDDLIGGCHMDGINSSSTKAQTFVFVVALSIHSFLEGLGMATKNTQSSLISFLISLFAHKWLEAFALGTGVAKACFSTLHNFWLISIYAVLTPAGILLGMWMDSASHGATSALFSHELIHQMLDGLALGSFLFVSCIEMIPSEFHKQTRHSPYKFALLCLGFIAMAGISTLHFH